ncbi:MAG: hypothetical protein AAGJ97_05930, partial [Planctomycetota bacterium]
MRGPDLAAIVVRPGGARPPTRYFTQRDLNVGVAAARAAAVRARAEAEKAPSEPRTPVETNPRLRD